MTESWHFHEKKYHKFQRHLRSCQAYRNLFVHSFSTSFLNRIFLAYPYVDIGIA